MDRIKVAVAMGGYSSEKDISLGSGQVVCDHLDRSRFEVLPVHIMEDGWHMVLDNEDKIPIDRADFSIDLQGNKIIPDVIFNTIHGSPGEDGYLAAYWSLLGIPQTSSDHYPAALSFNKRDCLSVVKQSGVHCAESVHLDKGQAIDKAHILGVTGLPCFVKPNRAGSSFGISKVNAEDELLPAIEKAFEEDHELIIERALSGTEVSVGVYRGPDGVVALPVTEIVSENDFFDYSAKYLGQSDEITPARISPKLTAAVQKRACFIYELLQLGGVARGEFILENDIPYFLEMNTTPGLSTESIIPKQVREAGMELSTFFGLLIDQALSQKQYL